MNNETRRIDPASPPKCELCGEPMPLGEEMFKYHGYSGPCPKPPMPKPKQYVPDVKAAQEHIQRLFEACGDGSGITVLLGDHEGDRLGVRSLTKTLIMERPSEPETGAKFSSDPVTRVSRSGDDRHRDAAEPAVQIR